MTKAKWVAFFFLMPLVFIVASYFFFEARKAYWDAKVRALCEKDGGVTVYEKVFLTGEEYELNEGRKGVINVMPEDTSKSWHQYAWKSKTNVLRKNDPYIRRTEYIVYRKTDKKELGKWVTYSRRGGDFPTVISHPSSFGCRNIPGFPTNMTAQIFIYEGE
jgi:hypothetical protein